MSFLSISTSIYDRKKDPLDPRLGDFVQPTTRAKLEALPQASTVFIGYPDDEGIKINGGRIGAAQAPTSIRKILYRTTPHLFKNHSLNIFDLGDLEVTPLDLAQRHSLGRETVKKVLAFGHRVLSLGGGHDYGFSDGAGFLDVYSKEKPLVINFDAHFDVRPTDKGLTSGTPFFRILSEFSGFDFLSIGMQSQCNSKEHFNWLKSKGQPVLSWDEIASSGVSQTVSVLRFLEPFTLKRRPCYLSIDIDGFSSMAAPGCSQSFSAGFLPNDFFAILEVIFARLDVKVVGIYEVSPPLDHDVMTSRFAAQIAHKFISFG